MNCEPFEVASYRRNYNVQFSEDAFTSLKQELRQGDWILIDENVRRIYADSLNDILENHETVLVKPNETSKSYDGVRPVILRLIESGFKKNNRLFAIGGGITQDVTAFISSILYRGIDWVFFPTNLLSQCDSCIGSKTSINFEDYKNQLGGFFPPAKIFIALNFLKSLDDVEIRSGLGEMAHYYLVDSEPSFAEFEKNIDDALQRGPSLNRLIDGSLKIKKKMIELDEFDEGPRNVFNYGHSFGHAIEGYTQYSIPHGIAVAFGMDIANSVSVQLGLLDDDARVRISATLQKIRSQTQFPEVDFEKYLGYLKKDKKNTSDGIRLILTRGYGDMFIQKVVPDQAFSEVVQGCFERFQRESD